MAATQTVAQQPHLRKFDGRSTPLRTERILHKVTISKPRNGVITLSGYGINVHVDRGHLMLEDGIGDARVQFRLPRVDHGLKRLVVISSDGMVSLSALRWLADQNTSFVMLDRDGTVLVTTGPVRSSDAKLRRAQALTSVNGLGVDLSRQIIDRKLVSQERVAMNDLHHRDVAEAIRGFRSDLTTANSIDVIRLIESQAARAYWSAWQSVPVMFPSREMRRVPEHWRSFGTRVSSLTGSPRRASNPPNAILNYLYALLESETRLAAAILGLDPGIGVLHVDTSYRDSLACDLMEPIRPEVDAFVLSWLRRDPLLRSNFFELPDGNCRLMAPFASMLSETTSKWAHLVAPVVEWFARQLSASCSARPNRTPARLTQINRREAKGAGPMPAVKIRVAQNRRCRSCGKEIAYRATQCKSCAKEIVRGHLIKGALTGRLAAQSSEAQAKRAATQQLNARARYDWKPSDQPKWLTQDFYCNSVQPRLLSVPSSILAKQLKVSYSYADEIRKGRIPHPRRWKRLAGLAGVGRLPINMQATLDVKSTPSSGEGGQKRKDHRQH